MARFVDKIKSTDVSFWGIVALVCGAIAVLSANMPSIIPPNLATNMHATRIDGTSLNHMRNQVAELKEDSARMRDDYNRLTTMLKLAEVGRGEVTRRVGAMESSLPLLLEAIPPGVKVDTSITTAGIKNEETTQVLDAEGGYVIISTSAIEDTEIVNNPDNSQSIIQPIEEENIVSEQEEVVIVANSNFGIALGQEIIATDAIVSWQDITRKVGPLLLGLEPILSEKSENGQQRLIAGPIENYAQAEQLCIRMMRVGISCLPMPYHGVELPK